MGSVAFVEPLGLLERATPVISIFISCLLWCPGGSFAPTPVQGQALVEVIDLLFVAESLHPPCMGIYVGIES